MHPTESDRNDVEVTKTRANGSGVTSFSAGYWSDVARIGRQIAEALEYAHQLSTLRRDIKPSNLIIDAEGTA